MKRGDIVAAVLVYWWLVPTAIGLAVILAATTAMRRKLNKEDEEPWKIPY